MHRAARRMVQAGTDDSCRLQPTTARTRRAFAMLPPMPPTGLDVSAILSAVYQVRSDETDQIASRVRARVLREKCGTQ